MQEYCQTKQSYVKYCCPAKQYYSNDAHNLTKTFNISPRVIIYKRSLKVHNTHEFNVKITNQGLFKRHLVFSTDSCDTYVGMVPLELSGDFLQPDQSLQICVRIEPQTKSKINRRRHVFIASQHPNIIFSIPIIILAKDCDDNNISLPMCLTFPSAAVGNFTYYEMIVYNKSYKKQQFTIKCPLSNLTFHANSFTVKKRDYKEILLKLYCNDCCPVASCLKLKHSAGDNFDIPFVHEPKKCSLFVNTSYIHFDCVRFKRKRTLEFSICNESNKDIVFNVNFISPEEKSIDDNEKASTSPTSKISLTDLSVCNRTQCIDTFSYRHFQFEPSCGTMVVNSTYDVKITFCPTMHNEFLPNDSDISPFSVTSGISISWENEMTMENRSVALRGQIIGPEIEILPAVLDLNHVYFGEEHCAQITVINKDEKCDAHVDLCGLPNCQTARIDATPKEGLNLKPNHQGIFQLKIYCTVIGSFLIKLEFKVKNGGIFSTIIRGHCKHVRVKCLPETLNLGIIPIAIPQKRFVLLTNPLTVPLTVQCTVRGDGIETPLVLNTNNVEEHLPITVKDPFNYLEQAYNQKCDPKEFLVEEEFGFKYDFEEPDSALLSMQSQTENNSPCSSEFEKSALDLIPEKSYKFVSYLKAIKIFNKPEQEKKIIEEALNVVLSIPYFCDMDKYRNYSQMDWNSLAADPQEIYCNREIIYLKPNTGKAISIVVIPNVLGNHCKYIELRVCPVTCKETTDLSQIVETDIMTCKLCINYNCSVPEIIWDNIIIMENQLYAGDYYDFEMIFQNNSNFGGFFYYDVIPQSSLGMMKFPNNKWKFFIGPNATITVPCQIKFYKLGFNSLSGIIKLVGASSSYPFHIKAQVLPPKLNIFPRFIQETVNVLETAKIYIFIENATPTSTWFKLKLKDESWMSIQPYGGQLAPNGQAIYVTLKVWFQDPGVYKNLLYISMEYETTEKIAISISVKGIPLFFEPEVRAKDINVGDILCNMEEDNDDIKFNFSKAIKILNKGLRCYRVSITRIKCSAKPSCGISSSKEKFIIKPNNLIVPASSEKSFSILISCSEAITVYNEFLIQITDINDVKHMESYRFSVSANFIVPQLLWNRRDITINYCRTHNYQELEQCENIKLTNITQVNVDYVNLKIHGPFKIKELFEYGTYENELNFSIAGLETKEFLITINKDEIRNRLNTCYEGNITCSANLRVQKTVRVKLLVFVPKIALKQKQLTLFTKQAEGTIYIELMNTGEIPAIYKWKKVNEEWNYISPEDDTKQVASIIWSDLMRMVEFQTVNTELDAETNMSRRYQNCECLLYDSINIKNILYEIIDNLALEVKLYKISYPVGLAYSKECTKLSSRYSADHIRPQIDEELDMKISEQSLKSEVKPNIMDDNLKLQNIYINHEFETNSFDGIFAAEESINVDSATTDGGTLRHLPLEDSYESLSVDSNETCDLINSVYFFEKCGQLQEKEKKLCALHIPPIRKGYEVRASFQLLVEGGDCQNLEITLVNLDRTVILNKKYIDLGVKPWYEKYSTKSNIENITNYQLSLKINQVVNNIKYKLPKIALGFNNVLGSKTLLLSPFENTVFRTEGIMGFNADFKRSISILINESEEEILQYYGRGVMPMLIITKPMLGLVEQHPDEIIEEYRVLQKLYYFDIFKAITKTDEEFLQTMGEEEEETDIQEANITFSSNETLYTSETSNFLDINSEENLLKLVRTYVLINNNEDLPSCAHLNQLLQTEKFKNSLLYNSEASILLSSLYQSYLLHHKSYDEKIPTNIKSINVQSLPFHLRANILDMDKVYLNQYYKSLITLEFIGPGKLLVAARTVIKIPGLVIDLQLFENGDANNVIYYRANDKFTLCDKLYRNMNERLIDKETDPKVKHAHSYDFNLQQHHERIINVQDKKCHNNYYNSLNKSIYLEQNHQYTHSKITAESKNSFSGTKVNVIILFRPQKPFFEHNQIVEDYLYIDLHLGATLPILLRGRIADRNQRNNT